MNIGLLIAGGVGNRMGQDIPKQFMHIGDSPVIIRTLQAFEQHPDIQEIAVVCLEGWEAVLRAYANQFKITKLKHVFPGGKNGQDSIRNGIYGLLNDGADRNDIVLIHDAVRPLLSQEIISSNLAICKRYGNAITAIKCTEAILESDDHKSSTTSIPRDLLWRTQTPQTFYLGVIADAHKEALEKGITASVSSCTMMVELGGRTLYMAPGEERNLKLTNAEDIELYKSLLSSTKESWVK